MMMLLLSLTAHAGPFAWVLADEETEPNEYEPTTSQFSTFDSFEDVTVDRDTTGVYKVFIPYNLSAPVGHVQVSAVGSGSTYCKVSSWGADTSRSPDAVAVTVRCFNHAGTATDSRFAMLFNSSSSTEWAQYDAPNSSMAYLFADLAFAASYTPALSYQFNSEGGTNTITRLATGRYRATLPGLLPFRGSVLVTAFGTNADRCEVSSWSGQFFGTDTTVNVTCHNPAGTLVDSKFTLSYYDEMTLANEPLTFYFPSGSDPSGHQGAYTFAGGSAAGTTALNSLYSWATEPGDPFPSNSSVGTSTRLSVGQYEVRIEDLTTSFDSLPLVTAYSGSSYASNYCKVGDWSEDAGDTVVEVSCLDTSGLPADSQFTLTYLCEDTELVP